MTLMAICFYLFLVSSSGYRAFSCDIMLSSNMAASTATAINIHLCKRLFTFLCITVSPWTSPFVIQAHDDRVRAWLPWISRSVCAIRRPSWRTSWRQWKHSIGMPMIEFWYVWLQVLWDGRWRIKVSPQSGSWGHIPPSGPCSWPTTTRPPCHLPSG